MFDPKDYTPEEARGAVKALVEYRDYLRLCSKAGYNDDISSTMTSCADTIADALLCEPLYTAATDLGITHD
jgi:hypothetical protein